MKTSFRKGIGFGLTSGIITTLGLMVGLSSSTHSTKVVIGGIIIIAIADSLSDALGIHISEEASNKRSSKEIWEATFTTFISKFIMAISFIVPVIFAPLNIAIIIGIIWGILMVTALSFYIAKQNSDNPLKIIFEHLSIAIAVVILTYYAGNIIDRFFN